MMLLALPNLAQPRHAVTRLAVTNRTNPRARLTEPIPATPCLTAPSQTQTPMVPDPTFLTKTPDTVDSDPSYWAGDDRVYEFDEEEYR